MLRRALLLLLSTILPLLGHAWGGDGHRIIAAMAESRLTTPTLEMAHAILGGAALPDVAVWSDAVRRDRPETAPWHYVNIHINRDTLDEAECPNGDCVSHIITRLEEALRRGGEPTPVEREESLKHLIHFVGDQSQPLHNANEDDRGGNSKRVNWFGRDMNLHSVWDSGFIGHELEQRAMTPIDFANELNAEIRPEQVRLWTQGTPVDWTNEGHRVAIEFVYPGWGPELGERYFAKNIGQVRVQLQRGAIRLAHVLNRTFDPAYAGDPAILRAPVITGRTDPPQSPLYERRGARREPGN